jgi:hypothetical protein
MQNVVHGAFQQIGLRFCGQIVTDQFDLTDDILVMQRAHNAFVTAATMKGYYSMKIHVLVRFGKWQRVIDTPLPADLDLYCVSTCMHHYAKAIAHASLKNPVEAEAETHRFYAALEKIHPNRKFFNNPAARTLSVGEKMMLW